MCARAADGQAVTANAHAQYIHRLTATSLDEREHLTVSTDILSTYLRSSIMAKQILDSYLRPAKASRIAENNYTREEYNSMLVTPAEYRALRLHGYLLLLKDEATENERFVKNMRNVMSVDQGQRRICWTCAFLSMLCKLLSEQGINVKAASMLAQMDAAGARWLTGAGTQPTAAQLEEFMAGTWFRSEDGTEFRVSIATSVCFNPQCMLPRDERDKTAQRSYENVLFKDIRECDKRAKFVLGVVNLLPVFVNGENMSHTKIVHDEPREACHVLGLLRTTGHRVKGWNSWDDESMVLGFPLRYVLSFMVVNVTQIEVRDSAQNVTCLMNTLSMESDWELHSTLYSDAERMMLTSSLGCDKQLYYRQASTYVKQYASQPMPQTAAKQAIKPPPAPAHDSDSTQNPPKKKRRTEGVLGV